jgi:hypothetical protein
MRYFIFAAKVTLYKVQATIQTALIVGGVLGIHIQNTLLFAYDHTTDISSINITIDPALSGSTFRFKLIRKVGGSLQTEVPLPSSVLTPDTDRAIYLNANRGIGISEFLYTNSKIYYLGTSIGGNQI